MGGVDRNKGIAARITSVHMCMAEDLRGPREKERDEIQGKYEEYSRALEEHNQKIENLKLRKTADYSGIHAAYRLFESELCASGYVDKYNYKICLYGEATQGHNCLGRMQDWESPTSHTALFKDGSRCPSGQSRSL